VRNFQARNHLRAMKRHDPVLFYHSGEERQIVGLAHVTRAAYPDPTAEEGEWSAVDLAPVRAFAQPVTLQTIKADPALADMTLLRQSRLSVLPVTAAEFKRLLASGRTKE
jgi:predicted RNA-binding protein with PUA-like domain